jgi:hypothetical protein
VARNDKKKSLVMLLIVASLSQQLLRFFSPLPNCRLTTTAAEKTQTALFSSLRKDFNDCW